MQRRTQGALLIADEVQTGVGRCGYFYAVEGYSIAPDILTSAKGLGGGIPCGAVVCRPEIATAVRRRRPWARLSAAGRSPLLQLPRFSTRSKTKACWTTCERERHRFVRPASSGRCTLYRAWACCSASSAIVPATTVRDALLEKGILTGTSADPNVLRILAPLVITRTTCRTTCRCARERVCLNLQRKADEILQRSCRLQYRGHPGAPRTREPARPEPGTDGAAGQGPVATCSLARRCAHSPRSRQR